MKDYLAGATGIISSSGKESTLALVIDTLGNEDHYKELLEQVKPVVGEASFEVYAAEGEKVYRCSVFLTEGNVLESQLSKLQNILPDAKKHSIKSLDRDDLLKYLAVNISATAMKRLLHIGADGLRAHKYKDTNREGGFSSVMALVDEYNQRSTSVVPTEIGEDNVVAHSLEGKLWELTTLDNLDE